MRKYIEEYGGTPKQITATYNDTLNNYSISHAGAVIGIFDGTEITLNGNQVFTIKTLHILWSICGACQYEFINAGKL